MDPELTNPSDVLATASRTVRIKSIGSWRGLDRKCFTSEQERLRLVVCCRAREPALGGLTGFVIADRIEEIVRFLIVDFSVGEPYGIFVVAIQLEHGRIYIGFRC